MLYTLNYTGRYVNYFSIKLKKKQQFALSKKYTYNGYKESLKTASFSMKKKRKKDQTKATTKQNHSKWNRNSICVLLKAYTRLHSE